jgi:hypothetical protein
MGELTVYEKADGGGGDLEQLQDVFFRADSDKLRKPQVCLCVCVCVSVCV